MPSPDTLPVVLTRDRLLLDELEWCADRAGTAVHHTPEVPYARRYGRRSPLIIVGLDRANRNRRPLRPRDGGLLIVTTFTDPGEDDGRLDAAVARLHAHYGLFLPHARDGLIRCLRDTVIGTVAVASPGGQR